MKNLYIYFELVIKLKYLKTIYIQDLTQLKKNSIKRCYKPQNS